MSHRTSLFVDRLSVTLHVDLASQMELQLRAEGLSAQNRLLPVEYENSRLLKGYRYAYIAHLGGTKIMVVQFEPRSGGGYGDDIDSAVGQPRFLRLEWNPEGAQAENAEASALIFTLLEDLIPGFDVAWFLTNARITRIDLSFDVYDVPFSYLRVSGTNRKMYTKRYENAPGVPIGMVFGKRTSVRGLVVYDKRVESGRPQNERFNWIVSTHRTAPRQSLGRTLPRLGSTEERGSPQRLRRSRSLAGRPHVRFEFRLKKVGSFTELFADNPFNGFLIRAFGCVDPTLRGGHTFLWFLHTVENIGLHAALDTIPIQRERTRYREAIRDLAPPPWWNPEVIRAELPGAIARIF